MNRQERKALAREAHAELQAYAVERARVELVQAGRSLTPQECAGNTPATINGQPLFDGFGARGFGVRSRPGRVERTPSGALKLRPLASDPR